MSFPTCSCALRSDANIHGGGVITVAVAITIAVVVGAGYGDGDRGRSDAGDGKTHDCDENLLKTRPASAAVTTGKLFLVAGFAKKKQNSPAERRDVLVYLERN